MEEQDLRRLTAPVQRDATDDLADFIAKDLKALLSNIGLPIEAIGDAAVYWDLRNGTATRATTIYTAAALATAECSHIHIPNDADAIKLVAGDILIYLAAHPATPRCPSTAQGKPLLAKLVAGDGLTVADVQWIRCDGDWATTEFDVLDPGTDGRMTTSPRSITSTGPGGPWTAIVPAVR